MPESRIDNALSEALVALAQWLTTARVPYALIGGLAVAVQAAPRFTRDIDVVVWTDDARWPELVASAEPFSITPRRADVLAFAQRTRVLLLAHSSGVPLETLLRTFPDVDTVAARAVVQEFADALEAPELLSDFDRLVRDSQPR